MNQRIQQSSGGVNNAANTQEEEEYSGYSRVEVLEGSACFCVVCQKDVPTVAEIMHVEETPNYRLTHTYICFGCVERIGGLFSPHNRDKKLYDGLMQDRDDFWY